MSCLAPDRYSLKCWYVNSVSLNPDASAHGAAVGERTVDSPVFRFRQSGSPGMATHTWQEEAIAHALDIMGAISRFGKKTAARSALAPERCRRRARHAAAARRGRARRHNCVRRKR
jgi:hypothetical protein